MLERIGSSKPRWRPQALAWRGLAVVAAGVVAWLLWAGLAQKPSRGSSSAQGSTPAGLDKSTQGVVVVPVTRPDGRPAEPLLLIPVSAPPSSVPSPTNSNAAPAPSTAATPFATWLTGFDERVLVAQMALARRGISSGSIDGVMGGQTRAALRAFQKAETLPLTGTLDDSTLARLGTNAFATASYVVTADDLARLLPVGSTWMAKSSQARLDYETILEMLAERSQSNPKLVRALNPRLDWDHVTAGTVVQLLALDVPPPARKAALVRINVSARTLQSFDEEDRLLAHFPCSIAARVEKRPVGETLHIVAVAPQPNYTFDPEVFPESAEARQLGSKKLILPPGPNNPVGAVWFSLDKPGYGIHGTPRPEDVGRTESHGCFRLANWNAEYLLKIVSVGTAVQVEP